MFREPLRHDKVLRNAAGDDAGDLGGYSTTGLSISLVQTGASIDCICGFFRRMCGQKWSVGCGEFDSSTAPQPWASLPLPERSRYRTACIYYVPMTGLQDTSIDAFQPLLEVESR